MLVECLTPDFCGRFPEIDAVAASGLDVYAHNLETGALLVHVRCATHRLPVNTALGLAACAVERLQGRVRDHRAGYAQSLRVLRRVRERFPHVVTKTSLMLGVGETPDEIRATMRDCLDAGVEVCGVLAAWARVLAASRLVRAAVAGHYIWTVPTAIEAAPADTRVRDARGV